MAVGWGLAALLVVGFVVNPAALRRELGNGWPTWPFQALVVGVLLLVGVLGVHVRRRSAAPEFPRGVPGPEKVSPLRATLVVVSGLAMVAAGLTCLGIVTQLVVVHLGSDWWFERETRRFARPLTNLSEVMALGVVGLVLVVLGGAAIRARRVRPLRLQARPDRHAGPTG